LSEGGGNVSLKPEVKSALVTVIQLIEFLDMRAIDEALEEMDLSDDAWEEELDILKKEVDWKDDEDEEEEEEDDG
jgi:hypothetical protein